MDTLFVKMISVIMFISVVLYLIFTDKNKTKIIIETFNKKRIIINLILVSIFYIFINYIINNDKINLINIDKKQHKQFIKSSNQALFGFVIAFFAHIDLIFAPFWLIFISSSLFNFSM